MQKRILITGANRGLGLEFTKQYAADGYEVLATCRHPKKAEALKGLVKTYPLISVFPLNVEALNSLHQHVSEILASKPLDLLINNAGTYAAEGHFGDIDHQKIMDSFMVNTLAPLKMAEICFPFLKKGELKTIVNITSKMGSIDDNASGGSYAYRASKCALNMITKNLAFDLKDAGIKVLALHPGWVRTDMGGPSGLISPEESVSKMRQVIQSTTLKNSGEFFDYKGQKILW